LEKEKSPPEIAHLVDRRLASVEAGVSADAFLINFEAQHRYSFTRREINHIRKHTWGSLASSYLNKTIDTLLLVVFLISLTFSVHSIHSNLYH